MTTELKHETWLITGAGRGLGLEMVKQLLMRGANVIGASRNPEGSRDFWEIQSDYKSRFRPVQLDVLEPRSIANAAHDLQGTVIDVIINNAGVLFDRNQGLMGLSDDNLVKSFMVNTMGPLRVARAFLHNLKSSKNPRMIQMSSKMGSIGDNVSGGVYGYRMSKAALNMFNACLAHEYPDMTAVVLHPGWVKTDMGGGQAPLESFESVQGILNVVAHLKREDSGRFLDYLGQEIGW
jgi:NAD(P)-dependent dehydrogenase (short-subunit alcohol dehydrogenase family)